MIKRTLQRVDRWLESTLPPVVFLYLTRYLLPVFDKRRRGCGIRTYPESGLYVAEMDGRKLYFPIPYRLRSLMLSKPGYRSWHRVLEKYENPPVEVCAGDVVVDVGANIGEFSIAAAERAAFVLALEPDPECLDCLRNNVAVYPNVRIAAAAAGPRTETRTFWVSPRNGDSSFIEPTEPVVRKLEMHCYTLSDLMKRYEIDRIDFLKIEAEGFEPEVLEGASDCMHLVRKISIDAGPERQGLSTADTCVEILTSQGYEVTARKDGIFAYSKLGSDNNC